jgi:hypothetical protein
VTTAADLSDREVLGMNCFHSLEHGVVGSNPTQGMNASVRLFCLYWSVCRTDLQSKESYRLCIELRNWKTGGVPKGCRPM